MTLYRSALCLCVLAWAWPALAFSGDGPSRDAQTEIGVNVSERLARQVLASARFRAESRVDFYVEIYDGKSFLLIPGQPRSELRLKTTDGKAVLQASIRESVRPFRCGDGLELGIKRKKIGVLPLKEGERDRLADAVRGQLRLLAGSDHRAVVESVRSLDRYFRASGLPYMDRLMSVPRDDRWLFTASHLSKKVKWKRAVDEGYGGLTVSVTEANDYFGDDYLQARYEIEFQPDDPIGEDELAESACRFLSRLRYESSDLLPVYDSPQEATLRRLSGFNSDLGF